MILRNPLNETLTIQYRGTTYSVEPLADIEVSNDVGTYWKSLHGFLIELSSEEKSTVAKIIEAAKDEAEVEAEEKPAKKKTK